MVERLDSRIGVTVCYHCSYVSERACSVILTAYALCLLLCGLTVN